MLLIVYLVNLVKNKGKLLDEVYAKVGNLLEDFVNCDIARLKQIYNSMNKKNDL